MDSASLLPAYDVIVSKRSDDGESFFLDYNITYSDDDSSSTKDDRYMSGNKTTRKKERRPSGLDDDLFSNLSVVDEENEEVEANLENKENTGCRINKIEIKKITKVKETNESRFLMLKEEDCEFLKSNDSVISVSDKAENSVISVSEKGENSVISVSDKAESIASEFVSFGSFITESDGDVEVEHVDVASVISHRIPKGDDSSGRKKDELTDVIREMYDFFPIDESNNMFIATHKSTDCSTVVLEPSSNHGFDTVLIKKADEASIELTGHCYEVLTSCGSEDEDEEPSLRAPSLAPKNYNKSLLKEKKNDILLFLQKVIDIIKRLRCTSNETTNDNEDDDMIIAPSLTFISEDVVSAVVDALQRGEDEATAQAKAQAILNREIENRYQGLRRWRQRRKAMTSVTSAAKTAVSFLVEGDDEKQVEKAVKTILRYDGCLDMPSAQPSVKYIAIIPTIKNGIKKILTFKNDRSPGLDVKDTAVIGESNSLEKETAKTEGGLSLGAVDGVDRSNPIEICRGNCEQIGLYLMKKHTKSMQSATSSEFGSSSDEGSSFTEETSIREEDDYASSWDSTIDSKATTEERVYDCNISESNRKANIESLSLVDSSHALSMMSVVSEDIWDGEGYLRSSETDYRLAQFAVSAAEFVLSSEGSVANAHAKASQFLLSEFKKMDQSSVFRKRRKNGIAATSACAAIAVSSLVAGDTREEAIEKVLDVISSYGMLTETKEPHTTDTDNPNKLKKNVIPVWAMGRRLHKQRATAL